VGTRSPTADDACDATDDAAPSGSLIADDAADETWDAADDAFDATEAAVATGAIAEDAAETIEDAAPNGFDDADDDAEDATGAIAEDAFDAAEDAAPNGSDTAEDATDDAADAMDPNGPLVAIGAACATCGATTKAAAKAVAKTTDLNTVFPPMKIAERPPAIQLNSLRLHQARIFVKCCFNNTLRLLFSCVNAFYNSLFASCD